MASWCTVWRNWLVQSVSPTTWWALYVGATTTFVCFLTYVAIKGIQTLVLRQKLRAIIREKLTVTEGGKARLKLQLKGLPQEELAKHKEILSKSVIELLACIKKGEFSAKEVLHAYQLKALEADLKTHCVTEFIKEAEEWAEELDNSPTKGPLHGLPVSVKDNFNMQGYDNTLGLVNNLNKPLSNNSYLVQILKEAGAIPFLKTNVPQTLLGFNCANPVFGTTTNPYSSQRVPGGSSGGEAALIALGGSIVGLGSDIGGSLRIPAHMCGIYCLKPGSSRMTTKYVQKSIDGIVGVMGVSGPMSKDVDGLALIMKTVLNEKLFSMDPDVAPIPFADNIFNSKAPLKIGYYDDDGYMTPTPGCRRAVQEARRILEKNGHQLIPFTVPEPEKAYSLVLALFSADGNTTLNKAWQNEIVEPTMLTNYIVTSLPSCCRQIFAFIVNLLSQRLAIMASQTGSSAYQVWENMAERQAYLNQFYQIWKEKELDAVLAPGFGMPAPPLKATANVNPVFFTTSFYNFLNFPAGTVPMTWENEEDQAKLNDYRTDDLLFTFVKKATVGATGMPIGVQIAALPWQEEIVLRVMKEIETAKKD